MLKKLNEIKTTALQQLQSLNDLQSLDSWRVSYLGRKGSLTQILRGLSSLKLEERKTVGAAANEIKTLLESNLQEKLQVVKEKELSLNADSMDVTLPGRAFSIGRLHPTTQTLRQIGEAFISMGFEIVEGPDVEWDYYNFEALNIPKDHPARDMWDTFWIDHQGPKPMLLRTHTSPMQIRVMEKREPPIRVIVPGMTYRYEATDATHESMFFQVEGFAVDKNITFADLKGTLFEFAKRLFGAERKARFRCDYFPFVEPGVEMAIDCFVCDGKGCRLCSHTGWIEIMGAGMIHPQVLKNVGYDSDIYSGFAFGLGVERIFMLRHGIDDIRLFYENDLRFLKQF